MRFACSFYVSRYVGSRVSVYWPALNVNCSTKDLSQCLVIVYIHLLHVTLHQIFIGSNSVAEMTDRAVVHKSTFVFRVRVTSENMIAINHIAAKGILCDISYICCRQCMGIQFL